jgi:hypothetical protein
MAKSAPSTSPSRSRSASGGDGHLTGACSIVGLIAFCHVLTAIHLSIRSVGAVHVVDEMEITGQALMGAQFGNMPRYISDPQGFRGSKQVPVDIQVEISGRQ